VDVKAQGAEVVLNCSSVDFKTGKTEGRSGLSTFFTTCQISVLQPVRYQPVKERFSGWSDKTLILIRTVFFGDPTGIRTRVIGVRGLKLLLLSTDFGPVFRSLHASDASYAFPASIRNSSARRGDGLEDIDKPLTRAQCGCGVACRSTHVSQQNPFKAFSKRLGNSYELHITRWT